MMNSKSTKGRKLGSRGIPGAQFEERVYGCDVRVPMHRHEVPSVSIVLGGGYREVIDGSSRYRERGSVVFHAFGESHKVDFLDLPTRILRVKLERNWLEVDEQVAKIFHENSVCMGGRISNAGARIYSEYRKDDEYSGLALQGILMEMFAEAGRNGANGRKRGCTPEWLGTVIEMLREVSDPLMSLKEIAAFAGVHPVHLSRVFRREFGCSVGEFLRNARNEKACVLLSRSDKSLSEIALELGFYDQAHFSKSFKLHSGVTPSAYRRRYVRG